jgi:hypothetical protein
MITVPRILQAAASDEETMRNMAAEDKVHDAMTHLRQDRDAERLAREAAEIREAKEAERAAKEAAEAELRALRERLKQLGIDPQA